MLYIVSIFGNLWVWKVLQVSPVYFVAIVAVTFLLINKPNLAVVGIAILVFLQLINFKLIDLTGFSNDQIRVRDERLSVYPPDQLKLGYYYEQRPEVVAMVRISKSVLRQLDPGLYFFAGHPRERIGVQEFEKFAYILFPVFVVGVYYAIKTKKKYFALFLVPFLISALSENRNLEFALFPFFAALVYLGLVYSIKLTEKLKYKTYFYGAFIAVYFLVMLQIISYEVF